MKIRVNLSYYMIMNNVKVCAKCVIPTYALTLFIQSSLALRRQRKFYALLTLITFIHSILPLCIIEIQNK